MDAGAVTGLAVGVDRAAVPDRAQRIDARLHHLAPRLAVDRRDEADAAGVVLEARVVQAVRREMRGVAPVVGNPAVRPGASCPHRPPYEASARAGVLASRKAWMLSAASRPSRTPQTTSDAPRTMSPPANTPGMPVIMVRQSMRTVPQRVTSQLGLAEQHRQVLGIEAERLDHQLGLDHEARVRHGLRPLAAGGIGRAQAHAHGAHARDLAIAQKSLRCCLPDELDALLLGVAHLAHRARHVGPVAPVQAAHRGSPLAHRGAHAVHGGVAAADHHHPLAGGVEGAGIERRHGIAQALAIARGEVVERLHDVGEADAGRGDVARPVDAGADEQRVVARAQLVERQPRADLAVEVEADAARGQHVGAPLDHPLVELEIGDAVDQQAAHPVVAIVDVDLIAALAQLVGDREPGRAGADHPDRFRALAPGLGRLHPAPLEGDIRDVLLDGADGHRLEALLDHAVAFAQTILRADAAADLRHVVGRRRELVGLLEPILGGHPQPVGDVVVQRAVDLAERNAALLAPPCLLDGAFLAEPVMDLAEVAPALGRVPLVGHGLRRRDETHHLGSHQYPSGRWTTRLAVWFVGGRLSALRSFRITPAGARRPAIFRHIVNTCDLFFASSRVEMPPDPYPRCRPCEK